MRSQRYNMKKSIVIFLFGFVFLNSVMLMHGCGGQFGDKKLKPFSEMGTKERASFLMSMYSKQYDEYMRLWNKDPRTESEQKMLEDKYELINELYPLIDAYAGYAEIGGIPPAETEQLAIELVNRALNL